MNPSFQKTLIISGLLGLLGLYLYGAIKNSREVNIDSSRTDQGSFMSLTEKMHASNLRFTGNRNQMPFYSFVQLLSYRPGMNHQEFFRRGKELNILLSAIFLITLYLIFKHHFPPHSAINITLVTAFSVFIFKAGYFHCSLLYYFLHFLSFLMILKMLSKPTKLLGLVTGIVMGITYLTKASFLPCVFIAFVFLGIQLVVRKNKAEAASILLVMLFFTITVFPYISESKAKYGRYFYNVNSTFYLWYETRPEIFQDTSTRAHGDRSGWPDTPPESTPGPLKYLRDHTAVQILQRFIDGYARMIKHSIDSFGFFKYIMLYLAGLAIVFVLRWRQDRTITPIRENALKSGFVLCYFAVYMNLFAFYMATGPIVRHVLSLFLPFIFVVSLIGARLPHRKAIQTLISLVLIPDIYFVLTDKVFRIFGAD